ncbi:MAG: hypothetical protein AAFO62_12425, partial [Pseudomonadota bacterium]
MADAAPTEEVAATVDAVSPVDEAPSVEDAAAETAPAADAEATSVEEQTPEVPAPEATPENPPSQLVPDVEAKSSSETSAIAAAKPGRHDRGDSKKPRGRPAGSTGDGAFTVTPDMMSILGCSADELAEVLKSLGFRSEKRAKPAAEIKSDAPPETSSVPEISDTAASEEKSDAASAPVVAEVETAVADTAASQPSVEAEAATEAAADDTPPAVGDASEATAKAAEEDDNFILVWRPRRRHEMNDRGPRKHTRGRNDRRQGTSGADRSQAQLAGGQRSGGSDRDQAAGGGRSEARNEGQGRGQGKRSASGGGGGQGRNDGRPGGNKGGGPRKPKHGGDR